MALVSGTELGPHEIVARLGAGGTSEAYRVRDARLGREVAIKVLPQHLSWNPREARVISSSHHARVCTLYDVRHQDRGDFLVVEYLEVGAAPRNSFPPTFLRAANAGVPVGDVNLVDGRRTLWKQLKSESGNASRFMVTPDLKYDAFAVPHYCFHGDPTS